MKEIDCDCDCINWARENVMEPGHHKYCPNYDHKDTILYRLCKGIELWASEEDGIPDFLVECYIEAKELIKRPCTEEQLKKLREE